MAKKKDNKKNVDNIQHQLTKEQQEMGMRMLGLIAGLFSKHLLQMGGCEVDFKINGEDISDIEKLHKLDITERIKLAVKEERYEDAAKLKRLLQAKPIEIKNHNEK